MRSVGSPNESPFRLAIYLGHWWPGERMRAGVRIVGGRLWLSSAREERAAAIPAGKVVEIGGREIAAPASP